MNNYYNINDNNSNNSKPVWVAEMVFLGWQLEPKSITGLTSYTNVYLVCTKVVYLNFCAKLCKFCFGLDLWFVVQD